jgi:hypothetical protein
MARRDRLSRDQKRKKKLAQRSKQDGVEPYEGRKYQAPQFAQALFQAEVAIHESDVATGRVMTDREVAKSLETFIRELRGEKAPPAAAASGEAEAPEDMVVWMIKNHWRDHFATNPRHSDTDLAGILRTILNSLRLRSARSIGDRGYLDFLTGFLGQLGVHVRQISPDTMIREVPDDDAE